MPRCKWQNWQGRLKAGIAFTGRTFDGCGVTGHLCERVNTNERGEGMKRIDELRRFADKESLGMEIAPYFNPVVAKSDGYNCLVLDVFDTETLHRNAEADPNIQSDKYKLIEDVDVVSDASRLSDVIEARGLAGQLKYVISSHNFEHLPDPISFLRGCSTGLAPGGVLSMAVPDGRACFDHFRMPTKLSDWLAAYHRGHTQPTPETLFDFRASRSSFRAEDGQEVPFNIADDRPGGWTPARDLRASYEQYVADIDAPGPYIDSHCSVFFSQSLELMLRDLRFLDLIDLEVIEVSPTKGMEFFVHLRKVKTLSLDKDEAAFFEKREELMKQVNFFIGSQGLLSSGNRSSLKRLARTVLGDAIVQKVRKANSARRARRRRSSE